MKPLEMAKDIYWVGALDWESRDFHGYSTSPLGTTYNCFLVMDEKITLFDTVRRSHTEEMMHAISQLIDPKKIDYIVVNHVELDHTGALDMLVEKVNPEKIFISPMGEKSLKLIHHDRVDTWPLEVVKTGSACSLGKYNLAFLETRMVHWPDSMMTYVKEAKTLISQDAFGQNIASTERWADEIDRGVLERQMARYFANIVMPYSVQTKKAIAAIQDLKLEIENILPDHGLAFRGKDVAWALQKYQDFVDQKLKKKAVVIFDTMWYSTEKMAHAIAEGIASKGVSANVLYMKANDHSDVMQELLDSAAIVVGSPTHNNGVLPFVSAMLTYMKGLRPVGRIGAAFGSYGWSGEAAKYIQEWLAGMKMELPLEPLRFQYVPTSENFNACVEFGMKIADAVNAKLG